MKPLSLIAVFIALFFVSIAAAEEPKDSPTPEVPHGMGGRPFGMPGFGHGGPGGQFNPDGDHATMLKICRDNPDDAKCVELREKVKARFQELRKHCEENPNDEKCVRMQTFRQERMEELKKRCAEVPDDEFCRRFREHHQDGGMPHSGPMSLK